MGNDNNLEVKIDCDNLIFGDLSISLNRTLRIPDDGKNYPLPPGLGKFPIKNVLDYKSKVPQTWLESGGVFIPMYQREAMWLTFMPGKNWKPSAIKIAVGMINAISGESWDQKLRPATEDYIVAPPQPWLDGINAGDGIIKQFVAMPLGMGYTVEGQLTGQEKYGGLQIIVYQPKEGIFKEPEHSTFNLSYDDDNYMVGSTPQAPPMVGSPPAGQQMGLAAGGRMKQNIYPDPHGIDTWDQNTALPLFVHIVNSDMYRQITDQEPPPTPVSAKTYTQYGYPWFDLYDESLGDIKASKILKKVKSIMQMDKKKGLKPQQDDSTVNIPKDQLIKYDIQKDKDNDKKGKVADKTAFTPKKQ